MCRLFSYSRDRDYGILNSSGWISAGANTIFKVGYPDHVEMVLLLPRASSEAVAVSGMEM